MKKKLLLPAALTLGVCALVGCTKAAVNPQPEGTLPHQGETAAAQDGSVYAVGETVTAQNGDTQVAQPVTNAQGELVGVTLMTPEDVLSRKAMEELEASYTGVTNRERITTAAVRSTSPNRLTTRPAPSETEPRSVQLPSFAVPRTTVAPEKVKVSCPDTLAYTKNGVTVKVQVDNCEASLIGSGAAVTLTVRPLSALSEPVIVQLSYNCYDAEGGKLNQKPLHAPAALNPSGAATQAVAPLPDAAARVEFFSVEGE